MNEDNKRAKKKRIGYYWVVTADYDNDEDDLIWKIIRVNEESAQWWGSGRAIPIWVAEKHIIRWGCKIKEPY